MVHPAGRFQGFHPECAAMSHRAMDVPKRGHLKVPTKAASQCEVSNNVD